MIAGEKHWRFIAPGIHDTDIYAYVEKDAGDFSCSDFAEYMVFVCPHRFPTEDEKIF